VLQSSTHPVTLIN